MAGIGVIEVGDARIDVPELEITEPGLVRLTGPNGSGKSTVLEMLGGGLRPRTGRALIGGLVAHSTGARRSRTVTRSESALLPGVSLASHARMFARASGVPLEVAFASLARAGLAGLVGRSAGSLSTGEHRRAWIALTTAREAPVRLLDEPFLGLDADGASELVADIERWSVNGIVVLVDHEQREIAAAATEIRLSAR